jgi:hypothetical protein
MKYFQSFASEDIGKKLQKITPSTFLSDKTPSYEGLNLVLDLTYIKY